MCTFFRREGYRKFMAVREDESKIIIAYLLSKYVHTNSFFLEYFVNKILLLKIRKYLPITVGISFSIDRIPESHMQRESYKHLHMTSSKLKVYRWKCSWLYNQMTLFHWRHCWYVTSVVDHTTDVITSAWLPCMRHLVIKSPFLKC